MNEQETYRYWIQDRDDKWLRHRSKLWVTKKHMGFPDGKGDLIWWMALYALITGNPAVIKACIKLLNAGYRWPEVMNQEIDADSQVAWLISKWAHKLKLSHHELYRSRNSLTRDPFIMLYCAIYWHQYEMIRDLHVPFYLNTPVLQAWVRYLEEPTAENKAKYEKLHLKAIDISLAFRFKAYSKHLTCWMAWIARSQTVMEKMRPFIPSWNCLLRELCGVQTITQTGIDNRQSYEGYIWNMETNDKMPEVLNPGEPIYMDKAILQFVYDNRSWIKA